MSFEKLSVVESESWIGLSCLVTGIILKCLEQSILIEEPRVGRNLVHVNARKRLEDVDNQIRAIEACETSQFRLRERRDDGAARLLAWYACYA